MLIEQIKLQKEINILKDNFNGDNLKKLNLSNYIIHEYKEEKDKLIIYQKNKLDYISNAYKIIKNNLKEKEDIFQKQLNELNTQIKTQEEQILTLKDINSKNDEKILELNEEINELAETNKNLSLEISTLNEIITEINNEKRNICYKMNIIKKKINLLWIIII